MSTYAYIPQSLDDRDGAFEASRGVIQQLAGKLGLHVDREYVEAPRACYVAWEKNDWRLAPLADRPVGREVLAALEPGDSLIVDNPMLELNQLTPFILELAERGVELNIAPFGLRGLPSGPPLVQVLSFLFALDRRFTSRRTQDGMLAAKLEGRPRGGRPAPGWKHIGPPECRRRVPNKEERAVMMEIVKHHLNGMGFRRISSLLTRHNVRWRRPDHSRRTGFSWEPWSPGRCERAHHAMLEILAEEELSKQAAGEPGEQPAGEPD